MKQSAFCIKVIDGDTLLADMNNRHIKVRLLGIDTPELGSQHGDNNEETGAHEALTFIRRTLEGRQIFLDHEDGDGPTKDKHGRRLAYVSSYEYPDIQAELVSKGLATVYRYFKFSRQKHYFALQNKARQQKLGIWCNS